MGDDARVYFDTGALAKWYLTEPASIDVERFIQERAPVEISTLTVVEMRCLLGRRRRMGEIDGSHEMRVFSTFEEDIRQGHLIRQPIDDATTLAAAGLISTLPQHPLRSLDAIHLAIARDLGAGAIATADTTMSDAARAIGMEVLWFG
ncbi:MAG: VapC toxin family PIN domain ribonuclease [Gemmatimonadetes bacterium]|nr:VapC toxin family PIN domain ribonuclease [Gemmatimonadota bacterium]